MYRKIDVFLNGEYIFSTCQWHKCKELKNYIRAIKHICFQSACGQKYITIYDYDNLRVTYAKQSKEA